MRWLRGTSAILQVTIGMKDKAVTRLDDVLAGHPDHLRALVYRGLLALDAEDFHTAVGALEKALATSGGADPFLVARLNEARWEILHDGTAFFVSGRFGVHRRIGPAAPPRPCSPGRLTVVFMAAAPEGQRRLDFEAEERATASTRPPSRPPPRACPSSRSTPRRGAWSCGEPMA